MKICFTTDLHGRANLYRQLEELLAVETPDLLILGGDMFEDGDIDDPIGTQVRYVDEVFAPRLRAWRQRWPGTIIACILGNHDWQCAADAVARHEHDGLLTLLDHRRVWRHDAVAFVGFSYTPPTPYWVKDFERLDLPDDELPESGGAFWDGAARRVAQARPAEFFRTRPALATKLDSIAAVPQPWIFVCHAPPVDTCLDRLPHVDYPVGSRAVRRFVERRRPLCALHGHIHESPGLTGRFADRVDGVLCVNPGQGRDRLQAVVFDPRDPAATIRHTVIP